MKHTRLNIAWGKKRKSGKTEKQTTKQNSNLKFNPPFSGGTGSEKMPHVRTHTLPQLCQLPKYNRLYACAHTYTHTLITDAVYTAPPVQDLNYPAQSYFP